MASSSTNYTASTAFFEALSEAGVEYCFANLGSDHPSLLEAIVRGQKAQSSSSGGGGKRFVRIITCPNEMVALSMADGYARLTGRAQCVLVHVDVGTQGLGAAVHNASCGRAPVLVFAGLSPCTLEGEYRGSRTEYIHWIQDVHDQRGVVAGYCRWTGEVRRGRNVKQMVNRALSFATSDPQGPVYLYGTREAMEEDLAPYALEQAFWTPVEPAALPDAGAATIAEALVDAREPLVVTGYSGRKHGAVAELVGLADTVKGLRVLDTGGSDMCFPASHPGWLGLRFGIDDSIKTADTILVLDCDVPWINTQCRPRPDARIYHVDTDPLKQQMPVFYIDAVGRWRADAGTALAQIRAKIAATPRLVARVQSEEFAARWERLRVSYAQRLQGIRALAEPTPDGKFGAAYLASRLRELCPPETIWVIEAVTNTIAVADQLQVEKPGCWINCGGGGLGWSGGGALGIKLAAQTPPNAKPRFITQIVGDGTFLFSVPSSVYWIAARYNIPILTIVLNNEGWHAPRRSLLLVHPDGEGSRASREELNIEFKPGPDYGGIARAAGAGDGETGVWAKRAREVGELEDVLREAVGVVEGGRTAVVDAWVGGV
ncbi:uncharacterized protein K452DRAFT_292871 [Aplosporella prunicola CBS 121167]|uniref:Uncharacterized protein n=1 Tax=Aplosporella prunicola CBS 121167 TaxID=1176127 RepID=A0A6A6AYL6_9PEZI|nr:uncharacterized protein K452DRAFT_292871 [Aplosporella prunicola CBS 121167]KAF2135867.1 hypothetical protein K452DRAFT_292871 [Aplosporella prunicola CBS 121167]